MKLDWNDVEGATYYQVSLWDANDWVDLPAVDFEIVLDGSSATITNLPPDMGGYYLVVRAGNAAGLSDRSEHLFVANPQR